MGIFGDIGRLMKAGIEESARTDYAENLRQSADLAEQMSRQHRDGENPGESANPFANLAAYNSMTPAAGTVVSLAPTGAQVTQTPVYAVVLDILIDGPPVYRTSCETLIAAGALHNWQPGAVLPFRVSTTNPHSIMLG